MFQVYIALIPKESKDTHACGNYRPLSLLNTGLKIFTNFLAQKVAPSMEKLIRFD